jgi:5'-nucleotidase
VTAPLILVTNDDGIASAGLYAAVEALIPLGEILIAAPDRQWSGAGRSMPASVSGRIEEVTYEFEGSPAVKAYAIDATPALCIVHAMLGLVERPPALVVSGINFGENVGTEVTISGTIGAALEAATFGIPALAVSVEMPVENHLSGDQNQDYRASKAVTKRFARRLLRQDLPFDVDVLSINLPRAATPTTPWELTRLSRDRYFVPAAPKREGEEKNGAGYRVMDHPERTEIGSDIWCLHAQRHISVTPLSLDLTARVDFGTLDEQLRSEELDRL